MNNFLDTLCDVEDVWKEPSPQEFVNFLNGQIWFSQGFRLESDGYWWKECYEDLYCDSNDFPPESIRGYEKREQYRIQSQQRRLGRLFKEMPYGPKRKCFAK